MFKFFNKKNGITLSIIGIAQLVFVVNHNLYGCLRSACYAGSGANDGISDEKMITNN
jgi:hypothetical protein